MGVGLRLVTGVSLDGDWVGLVWTLAWEMKAFSTRPPEKSSFLRGDSTATKIRPLCFSHMQALGVYPSHVVDHLVDIFGNLPPKIFGRKCLWEALSLYHGSGVHLPQTWLCSLVFGVFLRFGGSEPFPSLEPPKSGFPSHVLREPPKMLSKLGFGAKFLGLNCRGPSPQSFQGKPPVN